MITNSIAAVIVASALIASPEIPQESFEDIMCLSEAVYFEARNQNLEGMAAVALATKNRVDDEYRGSTYCEVINARAQYSYNDDGQPHVNIPNNAVPDADALWWSVRIAVDVMNGDIIDFTHGAKHYYEPTKASPNWQNEYTAKYQIGDHLFLVGVR